MGLTPTHPGIFDSAGGEVSSSVVEIAGSETYLYDAGEGETVLLLHGWGDTADGWRRLVPHLLPRHRVVALDIPPFGRSRGPSSRSLAGFYGEFFPSLYSKLGIESATLVGHSMGGAFALSLAVHEPSMVDRLILVAPAGLAADGPPTWWRLVAGNRLLWAALLRPPNPFSSSVMRTVVRLCLGNGLFHNPRRLEDDVRHFVDIYSDPRNVERILAAGRELIKEYTGTLIAESKRITAPVLSIWGGRDMFVPRAHASAFAAAVAHAQVEILDLCGHYPQIELPSAFNRLVTDFLMTTG